MTLNKNKLTPRSVDFNEWYNSLVLKADLADYGPLRGTMIVKTMGKAVRNRSASAHKETTTVTYPTAYLLMIIVLLFHALLLRHAQGFVPG